MGGRAAPWKIVNRLLPQVVHLLQAVDLHGQPFLARLELQRQVQRVMARLVQIAAVEPQRLLLCGLPHIALLAPPGPGSLVVSEPSPQTLPTLSATSWLIRSATQPFIEP